MSGDGPDWLDGQLNRCERGRCRVDLLAPGSSPRASGVVDEHVLALAEASSPLPPIIVHRPTMRVIDGTHRLLAAVRRGQDEIDVWWYDGDDRDAFAMSVRTNSMHGLPLSVADRRVAAARLIETHEHWSDGMIAAVVNLAATTVRGIRARSARPDEPEARMGMDGRVRRLDTAAQRRLAGELMREDPGASLRQIAKAAGLAPSTVLDVRRRTRDGLDPVPSRESTPRQESPPVDDTRVLTGLRNDPALRFSDAGRTLLRWFNAGPYEVRTRASVVHSLPPHCLDAITELAVRRAAAWQELADELKRRSTIAAEPRTG